MRHLDADALRALAAREPEAVAYFREHLASACDTCEEFLATHDLPGLLEGQVDGMLLRAAPEKAEAPLDEVGLARIRRGLRAPGAARHWGVVAGALAACLLAVVLVPRLRAPSPDTDMGTGGGLPGVKGVGGRIALELAVVARDADGGLRRVDPGMVVPDADVLLLRYHATEAGSALLFQQRDGQAPELLGRFPLEAGTHDLEGPQGLAGVSLEGEAGRMTLWLVASPGGETLVPEEVREALQGGTAVQESPLSVERFDVDIQNGQNRR